MVIAFGPGVRQYIMVGSAWKSKLAYLMVARQQKREEGAGVSISPSRAHPQ
jgi:hypothetical protein